MASKAQKRKAKLAERLIDAAELQIVSGGLKSVKARDLAKSAGCSLGAIYNVFDDLNTLFMAVNGRTFRKINQVVSHSVDGAGGEHPNNRLILMANAYLGFAAEHTDLWRALFDLDMTAGDNVPDWYLEALAGLFGNIAKPLAEIYPQKDPRDLDLMTRALFSAVHGIVLLGLEKRISGVPLEKVEQMISLVLCEIGPEKI